jgi:putative transposase
MRTPVNPYPSLLITDSKSVDSSEWLKSRYVGYDGNKKVNGVKLFLLVDKLGLCWRCSTTPANQSELRGVTVLIDQCLYSKKKPVGVKVIVGDRFFDSNPLRLDMKQRHGVVFEALKKRPATKFQLPEQQEQDAWREREKKRIINPIRWVVEQCFSHLIKARRLVIVYERYTSSYLGFVKLRFVSLLLGRLGRIVAN